MCCYSSLVVCVAFTCSNRLVEQVLYLRNVFCFLITIQSVHQPVGLRSRRFVCFGETGADGRVVQDCSVSVLSPHDDTSGRLKSSVVSRGTVGHYAGVKPRPPPEILCDTNRCGSWCCCSRFISDPPPHHHPAGSVGWTRPPGPPAAFWASCWSDEWQQQGGGRGCRSDEPTDETSSVGFSDPLSVSYLSLTVC